jgi:catechol 2,3-dioxygenase-like lactoylglutathione lyase family enzyme
VKAFLLAATAALGIGATPVSRPEITGVSHLAVYSTDAAATRHFYADLLGAKEAPDPEDAGATRYWLSGTQWVEVLPAPAGHGSSMLAHAAYATRDADGLRRYLANGGARDLSPVKAAPSGERWFATHDPEGNEVRFVQSAPGAAPVPVANAISGRIIHLGYRVDDRAAEDRFYRSALGFRPYWFGAMAADKVDWVSQQVPDGRDWLEYMLVGPGTTTPLSKVDARELGVLNHLSLGVPNMEAAVTRLIREDRLSPRHDGPQMGKDGKWQANLYDPDGTRVELMEFGPVTSPCCSPFTQASPTG